MTNLDALLTVNSLFVYKADREVYRLWDVWKIMKTRDEMVGDCEDYALTILWLICDYSETEMVRKLWSREAKLHIYKHTKNKTKHIGLQVGDKYVDNISRFWNTGESLEPYGYKHWMRIPFPLIFLKLAFSELARKFKR